jgi:hypothetical protein
VVLARDLCDEFKIGVVVEHCQVSGLGGRRHEGVHE